jgi:hypothetical protein
MKEGREKLSNGEARKVGVTPLAIGGDGVFFFYHHQSSIMMGSTYKRFG